MIGHIKISRKWKCSHWFDELRRISSRVIDKGRKDHAKKFNRVKLPNNLNHPILSLEPKVNRRRLLWSSYVCCHHHCFENPCGKSTCARLSISSPLPEVRTSWQVRTCRMRSSHPPCTSMAWWPVALVTNRLCAQLL